MSKMMMYVGCYTDENEDGIHVFEIDSSCGRLIKKETAAVTNASFITKAKTKPVLYSVTDVGIVSFSIKNDGGLNLLNEINTKSMRACCLCTDSKNRYIFSGGFYDGRINMVSINEDGSLKEVTSHVQHKNSGMGMNKSSMPHVTCVSLTPDDKYLCVCDSGLDQVIIYSVDYDEGTLQNVDILRCELDYDPIRMLFSHDGKNAYLLSESRTQIIIYEYKDAGMTPEFKVLQKIITVGAYHTAKTMASSLTLDETDKYMMAANDGDNTIAFFEREKDGTLIPYCILPISGKYPKDSCLSKDCRFLYSINKDENSITIFRMDYASKLFSMCSKPVEITTPSSAMILNID